MHFSELNHKSSGGYSALLLAVGTGNTELATKLHDEGADVHTVRDNGDGVLHVSAYHGSGDVATTEWALERGADVNLADEAGDTPLSFAAAAADKEYNEFLVKKVVFASLGNCKMSLTNFPIDREQITRLTSRSSCSDPYTIPIKKFYPFTSIYSRSYTSTRVPCKYATNFSFWFLLRQNCPV